MKLIAGVLWALTLAALSAAIVLIATYGAGYALAYVGTRLFHFPDFRLVTTVAQLIGVLAIALVVRAPILRLAAGRVTAGGLRAVVWFVVCGMMFSLFVTYFTVMSNPRVASELPLSMMVQRVIAESSLTGMPGHVFVLVLLVPVSEELLFRGLILGYLFRRSPAWLGLGVSTLLFAVAHSSWLIAGFAGLVYGLLYVRFQSLLLCVIAHGLNNLLTSGAVTFLMAYLAEYEYIVPGEALFGLHWLWLAVIVACMVMFLRTTLSGAPSGWFRMQPSLTRTAASATAS